MTPKLALGVMGYGAPTYIDARVSKYIIYH